MRKFTKGLLFFSEQLSTLGGALAGLLLFAMMAGVVYGVILRYAFNSPVIFVDVMSGFALVGFTLMSMAYNLKVGGHIKVAAITNRLSHSVQEVLSIVNAFIGLGFAAVFAWLSYSMWQETWELKALSISAFQVPLYIPQIVFPVGCALLGLQFIVEAFRGIKSYRSGLRS